MVCAVDSKQQQSFQPGDIVLTSYGVAVLIKTMTPFGAHETKNDDNGENNDLSIPLDSFKARLWREPGKSIASSATAYIQSSCVSFYLVTSHYRFILDFLSPCYFFFQFKFTSSRAFKYKKINRSLKNYQLHQGCHLLN